jgi:hypothetical protein
MVMIDLALRHWRVTLYGVLALFVAALLFQNQRLKTKYYKEQAQVEQMRAAVKQQNDMVNAFKAEADRQRVVAKAAMDEAKKVNVIHITRAQKILVEVPANSDECVASLELLRKYQ